MTISQVKTVVPEDDSKNISQIVAMVEVFKGLKVTSRDECDYASSSLINIKSKVKALENRRKEITKPIDEAKKSVMDLFRPATDALKQIESIVKPKIVEFELKVQEQERKERAAAEEKARKAREKAEAAAEKAREQGKDEKADMLEQKAATIVPVVPVAQPKSKGVSMRKTWKAEVTDVQKVCAAIAAGEIPASIIEFKAAELNAFAKTWQNNKQFEGLKIYQEAGVSTRS